MKNIATCLVLLAALSTGALHLMPAYKNANLMMSDANQSPAAGKYTERDATEFQLLQPDTWEYQPSMSIKDAAISKRVIEGLSIRTWYELPQQHVDGKMPLIIGFHGGGRDGLSILEMWSEPARRHNLLVVAPNAKPGQRWPFESPNPAFVHRIIEDVQSRYEIDNDQIFLFGHSDGAGYAQVILNRTNGPWKAAAIHAGLASYTNLHVAADPKPMRLFIGSRDNIFELSEVRKAAREFAAKGHDTDLLIIPNHNHWFYEIGPQVTEQSWLWFEDISLNSSPSRAASIGSGTELTSVRDIAAIMCPGEWSALINLEPEPWADIGSLKFDPSLDQASSEVSMKFVL